MSYCDFLIVGAMKAGTTTLYRDLYQLDRVFLPEEKEPNILSNLQDTDQIRADYAQLMRPAKSGQIKGEASTSYSKRPDVEGCADRALTALGGDLKIIYLRRDPVDRAISHYRHDFVAGFHDRPIDEALCSIEAYVDYGRYDHQIQPWIDAFGSKAVLQVSFEEYVADRKTHLRKVCDHLGIDLPADYEVDASKTHNSSSEKLVAHGWVLKLIRSRIFQRTLKPILSKSVRNVGARILAQPAKASPTEITPETRAYIEAKLAKKKASA